MDRALPLTADMLRKQFQAIPKDRRDANQAFSIRIWRGLSWLERAEQATDADEQFIAMWIAFNAIYGHLDNDGRDCRDHASWQSFLARMVEHDAQDALGQIVRDRQVAILKIIDSKFMFRPFWLGVPGANEKLRQSVRNVLRA